MVCGSESIEQCCLSAEHGKQLFVRNRDQRIDRLGQFGYASIGDRHALAAFHLEWLRDHGHRQDAEFFGHLGNDGRGTRTRAAPHAGRNEKHVGTLDDFVNPVPVLHRCLPANFGIRSRAKSLGDIAADLQRNLHLCAFQGLRIGIGADEVDAFDSRLDHVFNGIAAAAADANHLDHSTLAVRVH